MFETESMLPELEVAGWAEVSETGLDIHSVPVVEGVRFEPLDENDPRLYSLVGWDEKFAAHNAALWKHGLLVHVPKGVELELPLYVRIANSVAGRLALLAPARRRRGGLALHADRGVRLGGARLCTPTRTRSPSSSSSRPRSSSTSRSRTSRARRGTSPRTTRASSATPSSTGSPAASARRTARSGSRTT